VKMKTVQLMKGDKIKHKEKQVFLTEEGSCCKQRGGKFSHCCTICLSVLSCLLGKTGVLYR
jgi:hypothetical protein